MSPEELAAIRDRSAATLTVNTASVQDYLTARDDRRVLVVEVDRLRAEVDRLDALRLAVRTELANLENELGGIGPIPEPLERLRQIVGPQ